MVYIVLFFLEKYDVIFIMFFAFFAFFNYEKVNTIQYSYEYFIGVNNIRHLITKTFSVRPEVWENVFAKKNDWSDHYSLRKFLGPMKMTSDMIWSNK